MSDFNFEIFTENTFDLFTDFDHIWLNNLLNFELRDLFGWQTFVSIIIFRSW